METPLLVPSFSSKGFRVAKKRSEIRDAVELTCRWLTESMLVSAYDLHYGHIPSPDELDGTPELIVVDSGGYEMRVEHDLSTSVHVPHKPAKWTPQMLSDQLSKWDDRFPAAFVSFDDPKTPVPVPDQIEAAADLLEQYPKQLHTFLLKPETDRQRYVQEAVASLTGVIHSLHRFHIIGVTEKELGASVLDRMATIARLRRRLDEA